MDGVESNDDFDEYDTKTFVAAESLFECHRFICRAFLRSKRHSPGKKVKVTYSNNKKELTNRGSLKTWLSIISQAP